MLPSSVYLAAALNFWFVAYRCELTRDFNALNFKRSQTGKQECCGKFLSVDFPVYLVRRFFDAKLLKQARQFFETHFPSFHLRAKQFIRTVFPRLECCLRPQSNGFHWPNISHVVTHYLYPSDPFSLFSVISDRFVNHVATATLDVFITFNLLIKKC